MSFFLAHIAFEIAIVDKSILTKRTPHQYESITGSGSRLGSRLSSRLGS
jgi:hypothetical protein